ncbi:glycosyltransferase family 2 protein [Ochrobactrum teleogrylli]|uniref:Glycosyltransferase family 2 protein n=2 Tax=Ochrobactrum TaxID=528 RepID=A0ABY2Y4Y8_9HYPH|nr:MULTISPECIES: glycosyltransferase [Brucella]NNU61606.1 glycosyltransferase family 2 protein [[Ochrobactrum] soli]TNV15075.1 glycosyltransferase family 2 protein [[Ochrobactrum] teleogrylli]
MQRYSILISVVTRNRPAMLAALLKSLESVVVPEQVSLHFLVVENDSRKSLDEQVTAFAARMPDHIVQYRLEPRIGISHSRNCALNHAVDNGHDFLVFIDDDEIPEPNWLIELFAEQQRESLDIVGSPVRPMPVEGELNIWQKFVWSGLDRLASRSERKSRAKWENGLAGGIKVATGSWMGRLDFFRETGLRFDSYFGLTGGEDWHLWAKAKTLNAKTGWAPDAIVYETVPLSRLTLAYHFRRNRDHNTTEFISSYKKNPSRALGKLPSLLASRSWKLLVSVLSIPLKGAPAVLASATALGGLVGLLRGCRGKQSMHYAKTTGH